MTATITAFPSPSPSSNAAIKNQRLWIATLTEFQELLVTQIACAKRPVTADRRRFLSNEVAKAITSETAELARFEEEARTAAKSKAARAQLQQEPAI